MKQTVQSLPAALVLTRLLAGPGLLGLVVTHQNRIFLVCLLTYAFLSDVFDGVIARRLKIATERLRVADSWADTAFYLCVALAIWVMHHALLTPFAVPLLLVLGLLLIHWIVAMLKFRRALSYHAYSSKIWGLSLFAASVSILGFSYAGMVLWLAIVIGLVGHLEGLVMTLILPRWAHDVSGIPEALRLRAKMRTMP